MNLLAVFLLQKMKQELTTACRKQQWLIPTVTPKTMTLLIHSSSFLKAQQKKCTL